MDNNRYRLPTDRLINCLTPHYLSGRRYILLLQSLVWPLQSLNDRFCAWARERQIEARMTSQVMWFEWWLNYRFRRYFRDASDAIYITDSTPLGVDLYHEGATVGRPFTVWYEGEQVTTDSDDENPRPFHLFIEEKAIAKVSFMVCVPSHHHPHAGVCLHAFLCGEHLPHGRQDLSDQNRRRRAQTQ